MTEREQQILALIRKDPLISQDAIAAQLSISRSSVAGHIMRLVAKGIVKGRGYVISDAPFVVVIGGANMDICGAPGNELRMQDSNPGIVTTSPGGVARNIAENLARLDVDCRLIAALGNDHHGDMLLQQGQSAGIDMRHVVRIDGQHTSTYVSILDSAGDMLVGVNEMSIVDQLVPAHLQIHEQMLKRASIVIADTNLSELALAYLGGTLTEQPLIVDTVSIAKTARIKPYLDRVHTLKASRIEAEALAGTTARTKKQLFRIAAWMHDRGVARVYITLGPEGVFYSDGKHQEMEAFQDVAQQVANANGAGDAFTAGLAYAWLEDLQPKDTVRFAMSAANVALSDRATINPGMSATAVKRVCEAQYGR